MRFLLSWVYWLPCPGKLACFSCLSMKSHTMILMSEQDQGWQNQGWQNQRWVGKELLHLSDKKCNKDGHFRHSKFNLQFQYGFVYMVQDSSFSIWYNMLIAIVAVASSLLCVIRHATKAKQTELEAYLDKIPRWVAFSTCCIRACLLDKSEKVQGRPQMADQLQKTIQSLKTLRWTDKQIVTGVTGLSTSSSIVCHERIWPFTGNI